MCTVHEVFFHDSQPQNIKIISALSTKYFKYSYILVNKINCEDLMTITQIFVGIWTFVLMNKFKNRQTTLYYYYFCILRDVALNYHPTKFGSNCKRQCGYMDKTVNWRPEICLQFKDGFRRRISSRT